LICYIVLPEFSHDNLGVKLVFDLYLGLILFRYCGSFSISSNRFSTITAIGVAGGLIINGLSTRSKTKNKYYQILKELQAEFDIINAMNHDDSDYITKFINLHEKIAHLSIKKIISSDIASYFDGTFPRALLFASQTSISYTADKAQVPNLYQYCKNKKILPESI